MWVKMKITMRMAFLFTLTSSLNRSKENIILNDIIPTLLEMMMGMEALMYLEISFNDSYAEDNEKFTSTIDFGHLVDACPPTLTDLAINSMYLSCRKYLPNITSIQNLKLVNVKITSWIKIAKTSFPELTALHVEATIKGKLTISLPNHHLKQAYIEVQYPEYADCVISVNIMVEGKLQRNKLWPSRRARMCGTQISRSKKPNYDCDESELVDFTCASAEKATFYIYHKNSGDDECYDEYY